MISNTPHTTRTLTIKSVGTLPIDLQTAKAHLRVVHTDDDNRIASMIAAGVAEFEQRTGRAFSEVTGEYTLSQFPGERLANFAPVSTRDSIAVPRPPLISVESIQYTDYRGYAQTLSPSDYVVSAAGSPGMISPAYGAYWPIALVRPASVVINFTAGNPSNCSERIKHALLLWLDLQYHEQNEQTATRIQSRIDSVLMNQALRHPGLESLTVTD